MAVFYVSSWNRIHLYRHPHCRSRITHGVTKYISNNRTSQYGIKTPLCFNWAPSHEGVLGSRGIASRILVGEWSASLTGRFYPQRESPWYPLDRRLGRLQSRSVHGGEEKNSQPLPRLEPPIIQTVAQRYIAEVSRLLYSTGCSAEVSQCCQVCFLLRRCLFILLCWCSLFIPH
jgi:hypothetical protein